MLGAGSVFWGSICSGGGGIGGVFTDVRRDLYCGENGRGGGVICTGKSCNL